MATAQNWPREIMLGLFDFIDPIQDDIPSKSKVMQQVSRGRLMVWIFRDEGVAGAPGLALRAVPRPSSVIRRTFFPEGGDALVEIRTGAHSVPE